MMRPGLLVRIKHPSKPPSKGNHCMKSTLRPFVSAILVSLAAVAGQAAASGLEPLGPAEPMHFDLQSASGWPAIAMTPEGRRFDAYLAEYNGSMALLGRIDYLRPWHLYQPWPPFVVLAQHPDLDAAAISLDLSGNVLAAWSLNAEGGNQGLFARWFDSTGQARGEAVRVDVTSASRLGNTVAVSSRYGLRTLVAWKSESSTNTSVRARLVAENLEPVGDELVIEATGSDAHMPIAAVWSALGWPGNGYVAWTGLPSSAQGFPASLWIRSVDAYSQLGPKVLVLEQRNIDGELAMHDMPALGIDATGSLVLAWRQLYRPG